MAYRNNSNEVSLNGYSGLEMVEMFLSAPVSENIYFSSEWKSIIEKNFKINNNFKNQNTMNVKLLKLTTQSAEFELKKEKYTEIPYNVFNTLMGATPETNETLDKVVVFSNRDEYIKAKETIGLKVDETKPVYVGATGQIFCFLEGKIEEQPQPQTEGQASK